MLKNLRKGLRTWIEIDKKAINHNYNIFRQLLDKKTKMLSVVKSNAYGHNFIEFAKEQEKLGIDYLGVDSVLEALALRREGIKVPILVLGYTLPEMFQEAAGKNISITISSFESLNELIESKLKMNVHIKVDTGMFRHGFYESEVPEVLKKLKSAKNISVEGLFTHFSMAKDPCFPNYTKGQIEKFERIKEMFLKAGYHPICHASATSGILVLKEAGFDMVRFGIGLYGIWPAEELQIAYDNNMKLQPILSWKTIIVELKKVPKGSRVGYDGTGNMKRDSVIAVCPIGYWHGFPRALSNLGYVLVNGVKCKVVGRVCMDIIMIDVTDVKKAKVGDEVVLIGKSGKAEIIADEIAKLMNASTYELLTRINPLIKRFYI